MATDITQVELRNRIIDAGLLPPESLTLMITGTCNLHCPHCLLECGKNDPAPPVAVDRLKRIIAGFCGLGGRNLFLTGGEPLTHPAWLDILRFACGQAALHEVCMQTNATLIHEDHIQDLLSLPLGKLLLQVSLDGAAPGTNDRVRGKGRFDAALKALHLLSAAGLGPRTRIAFTEMRHNFDDLAGMLDLVQQLGLRGMVSGTLVKGGRSLGSGWIALPEVSQVVALVERFRNDTLFRDVYEKKGNIAAIEWFKGRGSACDRVCTCISHVFIDAAGKVYPCIMYLHDSLAVGNAHEQPLATVLADALPGWAELPGISRRRTDALTACMDCPGRLHCAGGCVGRSAVVNGDPMTVEDRCELRRAVYSMD